MRKTCAALAKAASTSPGLVLDVGEVVRPASCGAAPGSALDDGRSSGSYSTSTSSAASSADVAGRRHDDRDRLAHVADAVRGEQRPAPFLRLGPVDGRDDLEAVGQVGRGDDGGDAVERAGLRGVDAPDRRMCRTGCATNADVQHPRQRDVVDVACPAAEQPRILDRAAYFGPT